MILCGGRGTRLQERKRFIPKPLVEIGNEPIVWHVINIYAAQGFRRFMLCTGYRSDLIEQFISSRTWPAGVEVRCVDTGLDTPTGGRIKQAGALLGGRPFCATYSDGVANIDLLRLVDFHRAHGGLATMTVVRPELQFGIAQIDARGRVRGFREKPRSDHWVNGGFFCFEQDSLGYIGDDAALEGEPLEHLAADGQLHAFRHEGFWQCMDTFKDVVRLNDVWSAGEAPWRVWD